MRIKSKKTHAHTNAVHESHSYQTLRVKDRIDEMSQAAKRYPELLPHVALTIPISGKKVKEHPLELFYYLLALQKYSRKKHYLFIESACIMVVISPRRETAL